MVWSRKSGSFGCPYLNPLGGTKFDVFPYVLDNLNQGTLLIAKCGIWEALGF